VNISNIGLAFEQEYERKRKAQKRPTVLVAGYTGSGKTSLMQAICGKNVVPDDRIGDGLPKTDAFDFYEDDLIRFFDSKGLEPGVSEAAFTDEAKRFTRSLQDDPNVDNHVHLVWYTIQGPGARVTPCDVRLIQEIFPNVIVLITKNDITRLDQRQAMTDVLTKHGVGRDRILPCSDSDKDSLIAVVALSYKLLPEAYRDAFASAQMVDLGRKRARADTIIAFAAGGAAAAGAIPLPFSDAFVITPIQIGMIVGLAILYNEPWETAKASFLPVVAEAAGIMTASSLTKFLPGLGSIINAGVAFALTGAMGYLVDIYLAARFEARVAGKTPPEFHFDPRAFRDAYKKWRRKYRGEDAGAGGSTG